MIQPPPLTNDCFALPPGVHWTPVDEAQARLLSVLHAVAGTERAHRDTLFAAIDESAT